DTSVLEPLLESSGDVSVIVDLLWEEYFRERFSDPFAEAESLIFDSANYILDIGAAFPKPAEVQAQYIGLIKLNDQGCRLFRRKYHQAKASHWDRPWLRGRTFQKAYMTDFLQALIDDGARLQAVAIKHGWLEFDTVRDYEI